MRMNKNYILELVKKRVAFKTQKYKIFALPKDEVVKYSKSFVVDIAKYMGLNVNIEAKKREKYIELNLFSDKSSILIGKNGKIWKHFNC